MTTVSELLYRLFIFIYLCVCNAGVDAKQSNLHEINKVFIGTCPDMCPEKERYVREEQRRLSKFEMCSRPDVNIFNRVVIEYGVLLMFRVL